MYVDADTAYNKKEHLIRYVECALHCRIACLSFSQAMFSYIIVINNKDMRRMMIMIKAKIKKSFLFITTTSFHTIGGITQLLSIPAIIISKICSYINKELTNS